MTHHHEYNENLSGILSISSSKESQAIRRIVIVGCIVNALLMCLKLTVGYLGHSDALVADGFHSLNDFAADLLMLLFIGISFRKPDSKYSYGYGKYETFSTFLISVFLFFVCWHITQEAIESIKDYIDGISLPKPDIWTVVVVIISICGKESLFRYYRKGSQKTGVTALYTNAWHHRSDALASAATLIGVSCAHFFGTSWRILDPCASLVLVIVILIAAIKMLTPAFLELMDKSTSPFIQNKALEIIESIEGVKEINDLKSRKNGHYLIFDITVGVAPNLTVEEAGVIVGNIEKLLEVEFGKNLLVSVMTQAYKPTH